MIAMIVLLACAALVAVLIAYLVGFHHGATDVLARKKHNGVTVQEYLYGRGDAALPSPEWFVAIEPGVIYAKPDPTNPFSGGYYDSSERTLPKQNEVTVSTRNRLTHKIIPVGHCDPRDLEALSLLRSDAQDIIDNMAAVSA